MTVDTDVEDNKRVLNFFGMKVVELSSFRAIVLSKDMFMANTIKYKPEDTVIEVDNMRQFVKEFLAGNLTQHRKSEDLLEDWADKAKGIKYLVSENFASVAMDEGKDVLVEFYAP